MITIQTLFMKLLRILLYIVLALVALIVGIGLFARNDYHIERSMEIDAPREIVLDQIRYFEKFKKWSPWNSLDPNMKSSIEGTDGEVGALYKWSGNDEVGEGQQRIKSISPNRVDIEVMFEKPWKSTSPSFFQLEEMGNKTKVSWGFDMHVGFPWNAMAMLTDINAMVGKDYERGLVNLKKICEAIVHPKFNGYEVVEKEAVTRYYIGSRQEVALDGITTFYTANLPKIMGQLQKSGLQMAGAPSGLFWVYDEKLGKTDMAAAIPIGMEKNIEGFDLYKLGNNQSLVIDYHGVYDSTVKAHIGMELYMAEKKLKMIPPCIEEYVTDPTQEPDTSKWLTRIIYFVQPDTAKTIEQPKK
jgi:hypothetical protein